ncbi:MAG: DUF3810 domain-containing protein [Butyrivibrio sp.]|nr:DUF3810 domain-containing protein [Butyrivibrio sp.]
MKKKREKTKKELRYVNTRRYIVIISALALFLLIVNIMFRVSRTFAHTYSTTVYPAVVKVFGTVFSLAPFSVIEILIYAAAAIVLYCLVRLVISFVQSRKLRVWNFFTYRLKKYMLNLACIVLSCLIILSLNCTILYHRLTFCVCANIKAKSHTSQELAALCGLLIDEVNELANEINTDGNGIFTLEGVDLNSAAIDAMLKLRTEYPFMPSYYPRPKPIAMSRTMSYTNMTGFYSPFTIEANYNKDITDMEIPYTVCHELAHLGGFIHEDEANFIAYLACSKSDSPAFRYSGAVNALIPVLNACYDSFDRERYSELLSRLNAQTLADLNFQSGYWEQFESKVGEITSDMNDAYIKLNGDSEGEKRYGMVTDLLLDYFDDILSI